ncbi:NfeD family protein [Aliidiomarina soli]|nr:nodulation protein NfeD [Aliidiomarina soli]
MKRFRLLASMLLLGVASLSLWLTSTHANQPHVAQLLIEGPIGPATTDYLERSLKKAQNQGARLAVITIDTPGGLLSTTRDITRLFMQSDIPIVTYVSPEGARAASAGTFLVYASHIAAMAPSSQLGAATPVQMQADDLDSAMRDKVTNDAVTHIRSLAERNGRNADWAEQAVREAATLGADEALAANVVNYVSASVEALLADIDGHEISLQDETISLRTADLEIRQYAPDTRNRILSLLANPQIAYLLLLVGIYGLIFELMSPGVLVPGITGAVCLLLAAFSLQILPINTVGLLLIVLGGILLVAEFFVPSFGIIGVGGVIALTAGSLMLFDSSVPGMELSMNLIYAVALVALASVAFIALVMARSRMRNRKPSDRNVVGEQGKVIENLNPQGLVQLGDEVWPATAESSRLITHGKLVRVTFQQGTMAFVEEIKKTEQQPARPFWKPKPR